MTTAHEPMYVRPALVLTDAEIHARYLRARRADATPSDPESITSPTIPEGF